MHFWLVHTGEPLPFDPGPPRPLRVGLVAAELLRRGHRVTWWSSTFRHQDGALRARCSIRREVDERFRVWLLHGGVYRRHVSLRRLITHWRTALAFRRLAAKEETPDLILVGMPTPELAFVAARHGRIHGIPVVVDVRDMWPDLWIEAFPATLHPLARTLLAPYRGLVARALGTATAISASSRGLFRWALDLAGRDPSPLDRWFPHGAPVDLPPPARAPSGRGVHLVYAGLITHRTGLREFLETLARVPAPVREGITVTVAGTGPLLESCRRLAREVGPAEVRFTGWLGRAELGRLLREADLALLPYPPAVDSWTRLPNKFCEYLAYGLPVLTPLDGEVAENIAAEGVGLRYDLNDPASLAEVLSASKDPARLGHLRRNAARAGKRYRADAVYPAFADHLERLATLRRAAGRPPGPRAHSDGTTEEREGVS